MQKEHWIIVGVVGILLLGPYPFIVILVGAFTAQKNAGFEVKDNQVYLVQVAGGGLGNEKTLIAELDAATFAVVSDEDGRFYSKDKHSVFFYDRKITGAKPESFRLIESSLWGTDGTSVFFADLKVEGANPLTLKPVFSKTKTVVLPETPYAQDDKSVFLKTKKILQADPDSFELMYQEGLNSSYRFAKDKSAIFDGYDKIENSDSKTFKFIVPKKEYDLVEYAVDKNQIYYVPDHTRILEGANPEDCKFLPFKQYLQSGKNIYFWGTKIKNLDLGTFTVLDSELGKFNGSNFNGDWCKDKDRVYYRGLEVVGAEPGTFFAANNYFAADSKSVFFGGVVQPNIDRASFKATGPHWEVEDQNGPIDSKKVIAPGS